MEIDVPMSSDGIPVIYHDADVNLRLNQKSGLVGSVSDYTIAQRETFIRLEDGERIPTLKRMLATILRQTTLRFVWLDSKGSVPLSTLREVQRAYQDSARIMGRDLTVVIGLPDAEKVDELLRMSDFQDAHVLCELDIETVHGTGAEIRAPRWTLGTHTDMVAAMQAEGALASRPSPPLRRCCQREHMRAVARTIRGTGGADLLRDAACRRRLRTVRHAVKGRCRDRAGGACLQRACQPESRVSPSHRRGKWMDDDVFL